MIRRRRALRFIVGVVGIYILFFSLSIIWLYTIGNVLFDPLFTSIILVYYLGAPAIATISIVVGIHEKYSGGELLS